MAAEPTAELYWLISPKNVRFKSGVTGDAKRGIWIRSNVVIKRLRVTNEQAIELVAKHISRRIKLSHPHVLPLYGACLESKPPLLVHEDAVHGNIAQFFRNGASRNSFWKLFSQASTGLLFLETKEMAHGNLKCSNLLVGADGKVKISGFGFALIKWSNDVRWMAPECILGHIKAPSFAADVFALGMCIIEAWSGDIPWGMDAKEEDIAQAVCDGQIPQRPENMSDQGWEMVQMMCQSNPSHRPSLAKVSDKLDELMEMS